jgi:monoamine oxidase
LNDAHVIIIGAGAAGLAAARYLSNRGRSAILLEARHRMGGRILTVRDSRLSMPIELGAEFIHGQPDATWTLLREANLSAFDLPFEQYRLSRGRLVHLGGENPQMERVMAGLTRLGRKDISFSDYLRTAAAKKASAAGRRFARDFVEGFDAADPDRISAKALAEEQEGLGDVEEETQFRLRDGYGTLMKWMEKSLNPKRIKFCLDTVVSEIRWRKSSVEVVALRSGRNETFRGRRAIITLPIGVLQLSPSARGAVRFSPDIPDFRAAAMQLAPGAVVKAVLRFREPFWEDPAVARAARADKNLRDAVFFYATGLPFATWWTMRPLRVPVLTAWAGGPSAQALAGLKRDELLAAVIETLRQLFKISPRKLRSLLEHFYTHDWINDPFSRGAYSYITVGGMSARSKLAKPMEGTLFFAGEAIDTSGQASTVAGALSSGRRAAEMVIDQESKLTHKPSLAATR